MDTPANLLSEALNRLRPISSRDGGLGHSGLDLSRIDAALDGHKLPNLGAGLGHDTPQHRLDPGVAGHRPGTLALLAVAHHFAFGIAFAICLAAALRPLSVSVVSALNIATAGLLRSGEACSRVREIGLGLWKKRGQERTVSSRQGVGPSVPGNMKTLRTCVKHPVWARRDLEAAGHTDTRQNSNHGAGATVAGHGAAGSGSSQSDS